MKKTTLILCLLCILMLASCNPETEATADSDDGTWKSDPYRHWHISNSLIVDEEFHDFDSTTHICTVCGAEDSMKQYLYYIKTDSVAYGMAGVDSPYRNNNFPDTVAVVPEYIKGIKVRGIDGGGFSWVRKVKVVTLPSSATEIGAEAFRSCPDLETINFSANLVSADRLAFADSTKLHDVVLPRGFKALGNQAFSGCTGLTSVWIPKSLESMGDYAFEYCGNLAVNFEGTSEDHSGIKSGKSPYSGTKTAISFSVPRP